MPVFTNEAILHSAKIFGTPFFIYDADTIQRQYYQLKSSLPPQVDIYYSMKANPNIAIISEIKKMGAGIELCSFFEISAALLAGVSPKNIIFVGPGKSAREIEKCLDLGIYAIVCESLSELDLISRISEQKNRCARLALRVNPSHTSKTAMLKMGGQSVQFGMDEEIIFQNLSKFLKNPNIQIIGIHVYHGTRILDAETIAENTKYALSLAEKFQNMAKISLEFVDIGGGLGVPYFFGEGSIDFSRMQNLMKLEIENYIEKFKESRIILEVGRFLVATCGFLVSRIMDIKISKNTNIIITDAGMNCFMAASAMGSFINRNFEISLLKANQNTVAQAEKYTITGPLCTPGDVMGRQVLLPKAEIGDWIMIHNAGAYGLTASPELFLSHGCPAEILYKNKKTHLIRSRFTEENIFKNQHAVQEDAQ